MKLKHIICLVLCLALSAAAANAVSVETIRVSNLSNNAPIAENISISTYRNVSVSGELQGVDPEGDPISFLLRSQPVKGELNLNDDDGSFTYTPISGKKGRDSFSYVVCDSSGNVSEPATVSINIEKQKTKVAYMDMTGDGAYYPALRLAERGIFVGQRMGDNYYFSPKLAVSRGEFLAMCSSLTGLEPLSGITKTGFYDDADIDSWLKPYVSAALMSGAVHGYSNSKGDIVFSAKNPVTQAEAAVMLNNFLDISAVSSAYAPADTPVWAVQAVSALSACDIYTGTRSDLVLTRADAAKMLSDAMDVLDKR